MNGEGDDAERGRTQSISGTLQPVWRDPSEVFIVTAVEELILEVGRNENHVECGLHITFCGDACADE